MPSATLQAPKHPRLLRRLSSNTASVADLQLGPAIVVPDDLVDKESDAHEVASAMEFARRGLDGLTTEDAGTPPVTAITDRYAFAFDIDGVLIKGGNVIPEAIEAMKMLNGQNNYGVKVYVFPACLPRHIKLTSTDLTSSSPTAVARPSKNAASSSASNLRWKSHPVNSSAGTPP